MSMDVWPHFREILKDFHTQILALSTWKKISRDFKETKADPRRVHGQPWSFFGPYRVLQKDTEILNFFLSFLQNTFSYPSKHYGTRFWSLLYFAKAQGNLLDRNPNGSLIGSYESSFINLVFLLQQICCLRRTHPPQWPPWRYPW